MRTIALLLVVLAMPVQAQCTAQDAQIASLTRSLVMTTEELDRVYESAHGQMREILAQQAEIDMMSFRLQALAAPAATPDDALDHVLSMHGAQARELTFLRQNYVGMEQWIDRLTQSRYEMLQTAKTLAEALGAARNLTEDLNAHLAPFIHKLGRAF